MEREEAIQVVRGLTETTYFDDRELEGLRTLIPELAESEDERIRRELIEAFEVYDIESSWNLIPVKHILAWLEKQKEPHYTKRNVLFDKCVENCDPKVMKEVSDKVDEMLGKEQKPSCWDSPVMTNEMIMEEQKPAEWSEEDELMLNTIIQTLEMLGGRGTTGMQVDWLKSLRPQPHWKPSEEQMEALEVAIHIFPKDAKYRNELELFKAQLKKL